MRSMTAAVQELVARSAGDKLSHAAQGRGTTEAEEEVFKNMSERAAQMMKDDLEAKGLCGCRKLSARRRKSCDRAAHG